jgi:hypothetical protein
VANKLAFISICKILDSFNTFRQFFIRVDFLFLPFQCVPLTTNNF